MRRITRYRIVKAMFFIGISLCWRLFLITLIDIAVKTIYRAPLKTSRRPYSPYLQPSYCTKNLDIRQYAGDYIVPSAD